MNITIADIHMRFWPKHTAKIQPSNTHGSLCGCHKCRKAQVLYVRVVDIKLAQDDLIMLMQDMNI
jgi:hypothetical protein